MIALLLLWGLHCPGSLAIDADPPGPQSTLRGVVHPRVLFDATEAASVACDGDGNKGFDVISSHAADAWKAHDLEKAKALKTRLLKELDEVVGKLRERKPWYHDRIRAPESTRRYPLAFDLLAAFSENGKNIFTDSEALQVEERLCQIAAFQLPEQPYLPVNNITWAMAPWVFVAAAVPTAPARTWNIQDPETGKPVALKYPGSRALMVQAVALMEKIVTAKVPEDMDVYRLSPDGEFSGPVAYGVGAFELYVAAWTVFRRHAGVDFFVRPQAKACIRGTLQTLTPPIPYLDGKRTMPAIGDQATWRNPPLVLFPIIYQVAKTDPALAAECMAIADRCPVDLGTNDLTYLMPRWNAAQRAAAKRRPPVLRPGWVPGMGQSLVLRWNFGREDETYMMCRVPGSLGMMHSHDDFGSPNIFVGGTPLVADPGWFYGAERHASRPEGDQWKSLAAHSALSYARIGNGAEVAVGTGNSRERSVAPPRVDCADALQLATLVIPGTTHGDGKPDLPAYRRTIAGSVGAHTVFAIFDCCERPGDPSLQSISNLQIVGTSPARLEGTSALVECLGGLRLAASFLLPEKGTLRAETGGIICDWPKNPWQDGTGNVHATSWLQRLQATAEPDPSHLVILQVLKSPQEAPLPITRLPARAPLRIYQVGDIGARILVVVNQGQTKVMWLPPAGKGETEVVGCVPGSFSVGTLLIPPGGMVMWSENAGAQNRQ